MKTELTIVDPKEFGIEAEKGKSIEQAFSPKLIERDAFAQQYETIITQELNADTFKAAREIRLKLVKVRTGIDAIHKAEKAFFLASGKYVDALKNKLNTPIEQMEEKLMEIEKHEERLEEERKAVLKAERIAKLEPFGTDVTFIQIDQMSDEQFASLLDREEIAHKAKIEAEKQAEAERIEAERLAEEKRQAELKAEQERIEAQRVENERLKKEAEARERELAEKEAIRKKRFAEMQPMAIVFREFDAVIELPEEEYQKQLAEHKIGYQQHLEFQHEQEIKKQAEAEKIERERIKAENDAKRLKAENDKLKEQQEQERQRIEDEAAEKLSAEKAKQLAPDKEKINALFLAIKGFEFPECESEEAKQIITEVKQGFELILNGIKSAAKTLK